MKWNLFDNRNNIRISPEADRPIRVDINGENFVDILYAKDISMGGIGIIVPHRFKECRIDLEVSLIVKLPKPINKNIFFSSSIIHINEQAFGISFNKLEKQDKQRIKRYIAHRLKNSSQIQLLAFKLGFL